MNVRDKLGAALSAWQNDITKNEIDFFCAMRGEVMDVGIANCSEDPQIHKSVIDAAYEASPMPRPPSKACFKRDVIVEIESRAQAAD